MSSRSRCVPSDSGRAQARGASAFVKARTQADVAQVKLADLQADPNSPLYSVQEFEKLPLYVSPL